MYIVTSRHHTVPAIDSSVAIGGDAFELRAASHAVTNSVGNTLRYFGSTFALRVYCKHAWIQAIVFHLSDWHV
jgi:hypothetical protein